MADYTAKRIDDMQANHGGGFVLARAELGVTAFGLQVIQMPPNFGDYPEHDHSDSGQEEVFVTLAGSGSMDIEGERVDPVRCRVPSHAYECVKQMPVSDRTSSERA